MSKERIQYILWLLAIIAAIVAWGAFMWFAIPLMG